MQVSVINDKAQILSRLQREILPLQGFRPANDSTVDMGLGPIGQAFPQSVFPQGAIHEFLATGPEEAAAGSGFIAGLLSALMQRGGTAVWIGESRSVFPPALKQFGIEPHRVIFIELRKEKEILWAMEEALKCGALAAVVGELPELSFTLSRRLQLAVEQSRVTGFLLRRNSRQLTTTACVTRWKITPLASTSHDELPGIGFPQWKVELLKVRNGRPGSWQVKWEDGRFQPIVQPALFVREKQIKTA